MSTRERISLVAGFALFIFGIPGLAISAICGHQILTMPSDPNWVDEMLTGIGLSLGLVSASLGCILGCLALHFSDKQKEPALWKTDFIGTILCVSVVLIDLFIFSTTSD